MPYFQEYSQAERKVYTVSQINAYVNRLLKRDPAVSGLWVKGEVSNFKHHTNGYLYFSLKDENDQIECVVPPAAVRRLSRDPRDGDQVTMYAHAGLFERRGTFQLLVDSVEYSGSGALYEAFEKLKRKLASQGLFDEDHKKPLPPYPRRVGVVTSSTGAAIQDIIRITTRRDPGIQLVLCPALVQGEKAASSLVRAIRRLDKDGHCDVIIVGRGGGSLEDLWPFNEEMVARAVYEARTPIITGIGHEIDTTITDYAADRQASTPSAAAELAVPDVSEIFLGLDALDARRYQAARNCLTKRQMSLRYSSEKLKNLSPQSRLRLARDKFRRESLRREELAVSCWKEKVHFLELISQKLEYSSPLHALDKGYAYVTGPDGANVSSVDSVNKGQYVHVTVRDGWFRAEVAAKEKTAPQEAQVNLSQTEK